MDISLVWAVSMLTKFCNLFLEQSFQDYCPKEEAVAQAKKKDLEGKKKSFEKSTEKKRNKEESDNGIIYRFNG